MNTRSYILVAALLWSAAACAPRALARESDGPADRAVYLDQSGVVRWRDSQLEVALYGANYCVMSGSDYRMAGLVSQDRKAMIDEDMAHFARMGFTALRLCSWGDWENADRTGNLVINEHVDLLDYVIARARDRGIYILLTPIHTYNPAFADQVDLPTQNSGFSRYFDRSEMGTNPLSIAAQVNYVKQLLNHVNTYTGVAIKNEPAILFVEMINEPVHHPEDLPASIHYIDALVAAVRDTGCKKITFFNVSQDFAIGAAIKRSKVDGVSFGWYPTGLVAGHTLHGNFLPAVDGYPDMLRPELAGKPRIVYEFDQADLVSGYMYPAMARTFRSVGAQFATMFAYDMLKTAPFNLGWQTHYLNLVHTPRKAVSAVIAAEAMRRLPRMKSYGHYPDNTAFGDFHLSYENDSSELNSTDAFMNAGPTQTIPRDPKRLLRVVGFGSSPVVSYEGTGAYFLDKVRDGVWRLEVYPDEILVRDPFEQPQPDKVVSRLLYRSWPMSVHLPDLGENFFASPINVPLGASTTQHAVDAVVSIAPGIWLLSALGAVDKSTLPPRLAHLDFTEYHVNPVVAYAPLIESLAPHSYSAGLGTEIRVRVADTVLPSEVNLWIRPAGTRSFTRPIAMSRMSGNDYVAHVAAGILPPGLYQYAVSETADGVRTTFPGGMAKQPGEWPFRPDTLWSFRITPPSAPIRLLNPKEDYDRLSFVRPGEQYRLPYFEIAPGENADESALSLSMPDLGKDTPDRYAAEMFVGDVVADRKADAVRAGAISIKLSSVGGRRKSMEVALVERDGSAWITHVEAKAEWGTITLPLANFTSSHSVLVPSPFPGLWNYWREGSSHRGFAGDRVHPEEVERLQLIVSPNAGEHAADDAHGVAVESVYFTAMSVQTRPRDTAAGQSIDSYGLVFPASGR